MSAPRFVSALLLMGVACAAPLGYGQVSAGQPTTEGKSENREVPAQAAPPGDNATPVPQLPPAKKTLAEPLTAAPDSAKRYVIGSLDLLYIRVWGNQNLSGPVDVRPD